MAETAVKEAKSEKTYGKQKGFRGGGKRAGGAEAREGIGESGKKGYNEV